MSPRPLVLALFLLTACAPRLRSIALPVRDASPFGGTAAVDAAHPVAAGAEVGGDRRIEVALFQDTRRAKPVAEIRSGGDRQIALLESTEPVSVWLRSGIERELAGAGLEPIDREADSGAPRRLEGRLRDAFATERSGTEAHVSFHAMLRCTLHGEILLSRTYSGDVLVADGVENGPAEALGNALQQATRDLARDVARVPDCLR